jgi:hypothetical protein
MSAWRRRARLVAAVALALTASCKRAPVTQAECDRLLDRYTELLVKLDEPKATSTRLEAARVEARALALKDKAFRSCTSEVSRESMDCANAAGDVDQIERCLIPVP